MDFDVLDASAFYAGIPFSSSQKHHTTPEVHDEIRHIKSNYEAINVIIEVGRLVIMAPTKASIQKVKTVAKNAGELGEVSSADISVIALCVEKSGRLITDDFAVSNIAKLMGLQVIPVMTDGTRRRRHWERYCPSCNRKMRTETQCNVCGSAARRRPIFVG